MSFDESKLADDFLASEYEYDDDFYPMSHFVAIRMCISRKDYAGMKKLTAMYGVDELSKCNPMHLAVSVGDIDALVELNGLGYDLYSRDGAGETLMHAAASRGDIEIIRHLHERGVQVSNTDKTGYTPIHNAAIMLNPGAISVLEKLGADVNCQDDFGTTPLISAILSCSAECAAILIARGADVDYAVEYLGDDSIPLVGHQVTLLAEIKAWHEREKLTAILDSARPMGDGQGEEDDDGGL